MKQIYSYSYFKMLMINFIYKAGSTETHLELCIPGWSEMSTDMTESISCMT